MVEGVGQPGPHAVTEPVQQRVPHLVGDRGGAVVTGEVGLVDQPAQGVGDLGGPDRVGIDLGRIVKITKQVLGAELVDQPGERGGVVVLVAVVNRPGFARGWGSGHLAPLGDGVSIHDFPLNWRHVVD